MDEPNVSYDGTTGQQLTAREAKVRHAAEVARDEACKVGGDLQLQVWTMVFQAMMFEPVSLDFTDDDDDEVERTAHLGLNN